jgi:hypothetical protein
MWAWHMSVGDDTDTQRCTGPVLAYLLNTPRDERARLNQPGMNDDRPNDS